MARSIKGVGLKYYVPDFTQYLQTELTKGDIVYVVPEYENYHDKGKSIALFHNNSMISHAENGSFKTIGKLLDDKREDSKEKLSPDSDELLSFKDEVIAIRYAGSKNLDEGSFSLSLGRVVETSPFVLDKKTYHDFPNSAIYFDEAPYIMNEERNLFFLADSIIRDADDIVWRNANSTVTVALADELEELLKKYEPVCCMSLSTDCRQYLQHIIHCLENVCEVSDDMEERFSQHLDYLNSMSSQMRKGELQEDILNRQVLAVSENFEKSDFYDRYRHEAFKQSQNAPDSNEINDQVKKIKNWMVETLPSGAGINFETDNKQFAKELYEARLSYKDLYLVYAHIAVVNYCDLLYSLWRNKGPFIEAHNRVINEIHNMYIYKEGQLVKLAKDVLLGGLG